MYKFVVAVASILAFALPCVADTCRQVQVQTIAYQPAYNVQTLYLPQYVPVPAYNVQYAPDVSSLLAEIRSLRAEIRQPQTQPGPMVQPQTQEPKLAAPAPSSPGPQGKVFQQCAKCHDSAVAASKKAPELMTNGAMNPLSPLELLRMANALQFGTMPKGSKLNDQDFQEAMTWIRDRTEGLSVAVK